MWVSWNAVDKSRQTRGWVLKAISEGILKTQIHRIWATSVSEVQFEALQRIYQVSFFVGNFCLWCMGFQEPDLRVCSEASAKPVISSLHVDLLKSCRQVLKSRIQTGSWVSWRLKFLEFLSLRFIPLNFWRHLCERSSANHSKGASGILVLRLLSVTYLISTYYGQCSGARSESLFKSLCGTNGLLLACGSLEML